MTKQIWNFDGDYIRDQGGSFILDVCSDNTLFEHARLMAAAPELFAVCKELQESVAYWSEYDVPLGIVDRLNAAIKKAEE